jgi:hypothetical protein
LDHNFGFSRDLKRNFINEHVTKYVHWPGRPCRTKPGPGGNKRWPSCLTLADWPHFGAKLIGPWRVCLLECGKGSTDFTRLVWPRIMVGQPHGGYSAVFCHRNVATKLWNRTWDAINSPYALHWNTHSLQ